MEKFVHFVRQLFKSPEGTIPLHAPCFIGNEKRYVTECIETTFVSSVGKFVTQFEENIAAYTGVKYAIATVNGTAALHIALQLAGVGRDDEVITQPLTFVATANAIVYAGAQPVFVDVDKATLGLSPEKLDAFLQEHAELRGEHCFNRASKRRIKACVPMHTFGHPCRIDAIKTICARYHIALIEDAAESIGSRYKQQHTGTFGLLSTLSFNGNKTLTTGGGGMILTNDPQLGRQAKHLTTTAKIPHPWEYVHDAVGYNYRMPNINAALGVAQLENLDLFITRKRSLADQYRQFFAPMEISFISEPPDAFSNYWLNAIILQDEQERNRFLEYTNQQGVMTRPCWRLLNKLEMFAHCQGGNLDQAEWLEARVVNIPSSVII